MSVVGKAMQAPLFVKACCGSGVLAGLAVGLVVSTPAGVILGIVFGTAVGVVAGIVMDREDRRGAQRTRELDDIIGVTSGSLGAPPSIPPPPNQDEEHRQAELRSWVTEWMTPPPPHVG